MLIRKPIVVIRFTPKQYGQLIALGKKVIANLTGNLSFPECSPAISVIETAVSDCENAQAQWGTVHNRGSHSDFLNLQAASINLHTVLTEEGQYVQNVASQAAGTDYVMMAAMLGTTGFDLKKIATPQGQLEPVRDLRRMVSPALNPNQAKMVWTKPANVTSRENVRSSIVFRSTTPLFENASAIATVGKNEFLDTNTSGAPVTYYYWVIPVGAAGYGAVSSALLVTYFA